MSATAIERGQSRLDELAAARRSPQSGAGATSPAPEGRRFPFEFASEMDGDDTATQWRIDGVIEDQTVNLLYGPKDCLKSFLALDWGMSVAAGEPWLGHATTQAPFVYVCGEGHRGVRRRMKAWSVRHGKELSTLPVARSLWPAQVLDDAAMLTWQQFIREVAERFGRQPGMICIDTLSTNFGRGNQNDPSDMSRFIANIRVYLAGELGCPVVIVHHMGKNPELGARGGSSIEADADSVFVMSRTPENTDVVRLHCKHTKDEARLGGVLLTADVVELGIGSNGQMQTSLVLRPYATEAQASVLVMLREGLSHREIAAAIGKDKRQVGREIERLRAAGVWS